MFSKTSTGFRTAMLVPASDRKSVAKRDSAGVDGRNNPVGQSPLHVTPEHAQSAGAHGSSLRPAALEGHCLSCCAL